jgi:hypothetical protein
VEACRTKIRLGREEYCQRLLTMLILGGTCPRWNTRIAPSPSGAQFLRQLMTELREQAQPTTWSS